MGAGPHVAFQNPVTGFDDLVSGEARTSLAVSAGRDDVTGIGTFGVSRLAGAAVR